MINEDVVDVIHALAFGVFWVFLVVGALSVAARAAFYRVHGYKRPRLLVRDAVFMGGFALSFGLILVARVLPSDFVDRYDLRNNVLWALLTDTPAVLAVLVFVYFELFVIERGQPSSELRDFRGTDAIETVLGEEEDETLPPRVPRV